MLRVNSAEAFKSDWTASVRFHTLGTNTTGLYSEGVVPVSPEASAAWWRFLRPLNRPPHTPACWTRRRWRAAPQGESGSAASEPLRSPCSPWWSADWERRTSTFDQILNRLASIKRDLGGKIFCFRVFLVFNMYSLHWPETLLISCTTSICLKMIFLYILLIFHNKRSLFNWPDMFIAAETIFFIYGDENKS